MNAQPHPAAHCNPVHICDVGFGISRDEVIQLVFKAEVAFGESHAIRVGGDIPDESRNIPPGTKSLFASTGDDDDVGKLGIFPFLTTSDLSASQIARQRHKGKCYLEPWYYFPHHGTIEGV
jgi:hypothetical protein